MLINDIKITDNKGEICYKFKNGNIIKLGEFEFATEYKHVKILITNIAAITYEGDNGEMSTTPNMYWFESQYVCHRSHGQQRRDDEWVFELLEEVSPFKAEINELLKQFISAACDKAMSL